MKISILSFDVLVNMHIFLSLGDDRSVYLDVVYVIYVYFGYTGVSVRYMMNGLQMRKKFAGLLAYWRSL